MVINVYSVLLNNIVLQKKYLVMLGYDDEDGLNALLENDFIHVLYITHFL